MGGFDALRRLTAESLGAALLLAVVIGSGIMGERLAGGNTAIALLANALKTSGKQIDQTRLDVLRHQISIAERGVGGSLSLSEGGISDPGSTADVRNQLR